MKEISTQVCIVGAGPAGAVLGYLLARSGLSVMLLERSKDYRREFRGEFISPDSVDILKKIKVLNHIGDNCYLHNKGMELYDSGRKILNIDFTSTGKILPIDIPQPTLLKTLISLSGQYSNFTYMNKITVKKLMIKNNKVCGVIGKFGDEEISIKSQLVVGADGRYGKTRVMAKLEVNKSPIGRDFVWFNLPRPNRWKEVIRLKLYKNYQLMILPTYPDLLRVGFNIPSGEYHMLVKKDITELYKLIDLLEPCLKEITESTIKDWSQTSLLDIFTASLKSWSRDGYIAIGDAAHTLTPVLGQGVNHAISDAAVLSKYIIGFLVSNKTQVVNKELLSQFEKERRPEVEFVRRFQMRQEKMLQVKGRIPLAIRKLFYIFLGNSILKKVLMNKIFYSRVSFDELSRMKL